MSFLRSLAIQAFPFIKLVYANIFGHFISSYTRISTSCNEYKKDRNINLKTRKFFCEQLEFDDTHGTHQYCIFIVATYRLTSFNCYKKEYAQLDTLIAKV